MILLKCGVWGYMIRDWSRDDASSLARYANNRKIWLNLRDAFPHPYTQDDAALYIARSLKNVPRTAFAIATNTEAIGSIGLMPGQEVHRFAAELGYWLGEPFWGRGIMTEAVKELSEYALEELGFRRIFARALRHKPGFCPGTRKIWIFSGGDTARKRRKGG
ncbi:MAG: GNAT family N-acetyltransferase [Methanothrix sp.]|nr:GNAT family N-acetyltransferase [Methanothrix sp.]HNR59123.1 GNAT family N-acetyltransferase [Methanothrix sp.]HNT71895.1 GNAT family N-acetyltransferase [Methanothrix sp.]HOI69518.1 GNAT family N-acetyltransferase [Methanothrix sp.]HPY73606.1 GNAT family N-acetyltransferase [Methanothrix sp.]